MPTWKVGFSAFHNKEERVRRAVVHCIKIQLKVLSIYNSPNCFEEQNCLAELCLLRLFIQMSIIYIFKFYQHK